MFSTIVKGLTLGMINIDEIDGKTKITFKDPVTGVLNMGKDLLNTSR